MHERPVADHTVTFFARVLTHRRNPDAVARREIANGDWFKKLGHKL